MGTPIINSQMDSVNASFTNIKDDLVAIRPLLKNASIGAYPTDSASGSIASFSDGADGVPVKELKVSIAPLQSGSGDPSPSNVRPISGWDSVNVVRTGKNLLNSADFVLKAWNGTGTNNTRARLETAIKLPVGTQLTFSRNSTATYVFTIQELDADYPGNASSNPSYDIVSWSSLSSYTWTTTHPYVGILFRRTDNGNITLDDLKAVEMQVEVGATATDYESYTAPTTTPITLPSTVYGGTLDVTTGELVVDRAITTIGNLTWTYTTADSTFRSTSLVSAIEYAWRKLVCEAFKAVASAVLSSDDMCISVTSGGGMRIKNSSYTDASAFKTAFADTKFVYPLATPLTYSLTPTEVSTLLGQNNIWADAGEVEVSYRADTTLYIQQLTKPDEDFIADSSIASGKFFMVGNRLFLSTTAISAGESIVVGTNCTEVSLADALNQINA